MSRSSSPHSIVIVRIDMDVQLVFASVLVSEQYGVTFNS